MMKMQPNSLSPAHRASVFLDKEIARMLGPQTFTVISWWTWFHVNNWWELFLCLNINYYYSFKIFPCFWLVKTTGVIHHNQLLLTKFGKKLCQIELMTPKVQPTADYWTVDQENLRTRLCYFWWAEKQRAKWQNSFKNGKIFWMNNEAIIEFGFRRMLRILQISEGVSTSASGLCG